MKSKTIFIVLCLFFINVIYSQTLLENKIYYGTDFHKYKDEIKGKLGEVNCQIFKFDKQNVTIYNYNRFIYNVNEFSDTLIFNLKGNYKIKTEPYEITDNEIAFEDSKYKHFIIDSISIKAYKNSDFKLLNLPNTFTEISNSEFENIITNVQ